MACGGPLVRRPAFVAKNQTTGQYLKTDFHVFECEQCRQFFLPRVASWPVTARERRLMTDAVVRHVVALERGATRVEQLQRALQTEELRQAQDNFLIDVTLARDSDSAEASFLADFRSLGVELKAPTDLPRPTTLVGQAFARTLEQLDQMVRLYKAGQLQTLAGGVRQHLVILLTGSPGVGKSLLAAELARRTGRTLVIVRGGTLLGGIQGATIANLEKLFCALESARSAGLNFLLFWNEFDGLAGSTGDPGADRLSTNATLNTILDRFHGIGLFDSNYPDRIQPSHASRFVSVELPNPNAADLADYMTRYVQRIGTKVPVRKLPVLAKCLDGAATYRDLETILHRAQVDTALSGGNGVSVGSLITSIRKFKSSRAAQKSVTKPNFEKVLRAYNKSQVQALEAISDNMIRKAKRYTDIKINEVRSDFE